MSNPTTPFSWQMPTSTDLVTDLPADFEVFGQAVATSMADLLGGTTGQVLAKNSGTDMDFVWSTPAGAPAFVGAIAYGAVNLAFNTAATAISGLTTEIVDTNGFHSTATNTERMTIPTGYGGKYLIQMDMNLASTASMQNIYLRVRKNGTNITEGLTSGNLATILTGLAQDGHLNVSLLVTGVATDYFDLTIQTGASSSTIDKARYSFTYLGA